MMGGVTLGFALLSVGLITGFGARGYLLAAEWLCAETAQPLRVARSKRVARVVR